VIANGGMATYDDCMKCLEFTGCDGVMSSESILEYPALFDNSRLWDMDDLTMEFLEMVEKYPGESDIKNTRSHVHKFLHIGLKVHTDLRDRVAESKSVADLKLIVAEMKDRRKLQDPVEKLGWYYRYWNSLKVSKDTASTYTLQDWNTQISTDPLFNKKLKE
jgi:tRNA-dihydrouridine synthase